MGIPVDSSSSALPPGCATLPTALPPTPSKSLPFSTSCSRCRGLDLLAMAALHVSGAAEDELERRDGEASDDLKVAMSVKPEGAIGQGRVEFSALVNRSRRQKLMPSKYQDSILQPWKRGSRKRRRPAAAERSG